jgi:hypothetical protein
MLDIIPYIDCLVKKLFQKVSYLPESLDIPAAYEITILFISCGRYNYNVTVANPTDFVYFFEMLISVV